GAKAAQTLATHFETMENLQQASYDALVAVDEIGEKMADAIVKYFSEEKVIALIADLKKLNVNMTYTGTKQDEQDTVFIGKKIGRAGKMESYNRSEAKGNIEAMSGYVTGSVSKKTNIVVAGEAAGYKYERALELGVTVWDEQLLREAIEMKVL